MRTLKEGIADELHQISRKNFPRRKTRIFGWGELMAGDLCDMRKFQSKNKHFKYILLLIDVFSRYVHCVALKKKNSQTMHDAFKKIFKKKKPKLLWTDRGTEFYNKKVKELLAKKKIKLYHTYNNKIKSTFAERAIRTIKGNLVKNFTIIGSENWIDYLDKIVKEYNEKIHSSTGYAPAHMNEKIAEEIIRKNLKKNENIYPRKKESRFKIGDIVRISSEKDIFEKSYTIEWSVEYFIIKDIKYTQPITYILSDLSGEEIQGRFYAEELMKTKYPHKYLIEKILKKKNDKSLVKYFGFSEPIWENNKDL